MVNFRYRRRLEPLVRDINVEGTRNMLLAATQSGCKCFVYTSSCCAVTDDMKQSYANIDEQWPAAKRSSIYGESKRDAEQLVLSHDDESIATCVLRPCVIFGEGDTQLIPPIHNCIVKGESRWIIGDAMNLWDTVYVGNVADAHVLAVENLLRTTVLPSTNSSETDSTRESAAGEIFFIQNNEPVSFRDFSLAVWKEFGHYPDVEIQIPAGLGWALGLIADTFTRLLGTPTTLSRGSVMDACAMRYASGEKAGKILGYKPRVALEEGLRRSCQVCCPAVGSNPCPSNSYGACAH
jgi:sterol-4alpha-carboxylate 3-dehydrogenase (decarboxylating)